MDTETLKDILEEIWTTCGRPDSKQAHPESIPVERVWIWAHRIAYQLELGRVGDAAGVRKLFEEVIGNPIHIVMGFPCAEKECQDRLEDWRTRLDALLDREKRNCKDCMHRFSCGHKDTVEWLMERSMENEAALQALAAACNQWEDGDENNA